ncbi:4Fe-4S dicluster domain-containing protein [Chloroflexus aggregans]|uniref:4Fe-4S ferredoxin iron-sulfur binding domain protein n=1 Tax=Chloroflexus aggregans (strain MD-66 / DSM 9485) TaxID=326427 RepID=B8GA13_CHLAD|nr:4Fe-4S dicluster domain-containing protein [Chloroflexus aggregans]ACL24528.1 4Fe-4S ferredoxin iron-sulfur binding domain protein [Chloroflexus aggregans DSM 9485]
MTVPPFEIEIPHGRVIEVQRDDTRVRRGGGLLRGMAVIWKHWKESFKLNRSYSQIHGTFTIQYPEERARIPETYRNMPILLYDDETGHELCTSCFQCERICPPQVIHMTQAKDPATGKPVPAVAEFIIEYDACMSCGFCAEVCPFDAIKMDHEFELSTDDHARLTVHKEQLNRPISYYAKIAPTMWAEVRESALKKLQGNIRRRPDVIGIAPHLTERIAARRAELAAQAAQTTPVAPSDQATPPTTEGRKLTPEEKAAKLAAIRAAKGAQAGDGASPATESAPPTDKAAKLAAIRAANAAKRAAAGESTTPAATEPPAAPPTDKAAKLAAIRAANAAKRAAAGESTTPAATEPPAAPPTDKAARLAAIRAANAAKRAAAGESTTPAATEPPAEPSAAPPTDKAARLAAIRAANAAKKQQSGDESSS